MATLVEFLNARLDEDEKIGRMLQRSSLGEGRQVRLLADVESKRAIVAAHGRTVDDPYRDSENYIAERDGGIHYDCDQCYHDRDYGSIPDKEPCLTLRLLAQPFRDHPDFDPAWAVR